MIALNEINIRHTLEPGDLGYMMHRHGIIYHKEYNYGISFEIYVGQGLSEFYMNFEPELDRIWIAEHNNRIQGTLVLMHREPGVAQLRYFLLELPYRGIGLGNKLMGLYIEFLKAKSYKQAYLWTTEEQHKAAALYRNYGFRLTEEKHSEAFGKPLKEQRYDLLLNSEK
jgi:peptidyl-dipeptidase Dcp